MKAFPFAAAVFIALGFVGCHSSDAPMVPLGGLSACSPNSAVIFVSDGLLQISCGCAEAAGTAASSTAPLTCTVPSGTNVVFAFTNPRLRHQLVPSAGSTFPAGPLVDPSDKHPVTIYSLTFPNVGVFGYQDSFDPLNNGSIVVH